MENLTVTGSNWLQPGDVLHLEVKCGGSPPYHYCVKFITGVYNVTGNETCEEWLILDQCGFHITHYFLEEKVNTILVLMKNDVTRINKIITVNIYDVKKQSQLSVIVVPVAFILVAVILVIFGVARYMQSKNR